MNEPPEKVINRLGWLMERDTIEDRGFCASCGGFNTPWRETPEEVVADVLAVKGRENAAAIGPVKARW